MSGQVAVKAYKLPTERLYSLCTLSTSLIMTRYYEDYNMDLPAIGAKRCDKHINTTYNVNTADILPCYGKKGGEKVGQYPEKMGKWALDYQNGTSLHWNIMSITKNRHK